MHSLFTPDRRFASREPASGRVELRFANPMPASIEAEMVESSALGFRAAHNSTALVPGLEATFSRGAESGRARVIWTHVIGSKRVSGFLIL